MHNFGHLSLKKLLTLSHSSIHTLLPYSPLEKNHIKAHSQVKSRLSEVPKGASTLQTLPKILIPGHKWPSRPSWGSNFLVFYKVN